MDPHLGRSARIFAVVHKVQKRLKLKAQKFYQRLTSCGCHAPPRGVSTFRFAEFSAFSGFRSTSPGLASGVVRFVFVRWAYRPRRWRIGGPTKHQRRIIVVIETAPTAAAAAAATATATAGPHC